ncbi:MAG: aminotransferase class V-fold PLP-dependent enzyme [Gammaproteobacteria bacterium]
MTLDIDFVRSQFPAFAEPGLEGQAFFENAGGSYACRQVIDRLCSYYRANKVQPYYPFAASAQAGAQMDAAYVRLAEYLNVTPEEVHIGPSTSQNTATLAQAFRNVFRPGDEIIVTNQDHEANIGVWRRLEGDGLVIRQWSIDPASGLLDPDDLDGLFTDRTRLIAFTHCSNLIAHINPVAEICAKARAAGVISVVDGVSFAGHGLPDVRALGADIYLFSSYKTFGPHQGIMTVRPEITELLGNQGHFFNGALVHKRLVPAGPDHAQVAALNGVAEYFDALDAHHHPDEDIADRPARVRALMHAAEIPMLKCLLAFLEGRPGIRLLGSSDASERAPTVSVIVRDHPAIDLSTELAARGIMAGGGHYYAYRALQGLGEDPERGALRLSFVHYTHEEEMDRLIEALDELLP